MWPGPDHPYQELPPLPPAEQIETPQVLKAVIAASRALAALDQACRRLPEPAMLINLLPVLEAQASSEIENIVTTNDELFRAVGGGGEERPTPAVKEALRYRQALRTGYESLASRPITTNTAIEVCSTIQGREAVIRNQPGTFIGNPRTRERIYTPPEGRDVILDHLSAWERFLHADTDLDPLVTMALQHYQFEAVHPFFDGNGRTGRVLNLLYLVEQGLLQWPVLYLSGHIVRHKDDYYDALRGVTADGDWHRWTLFMLDAVRATAAWTLELIEQIEHLRSAFEQNLAQTLPQLPAGDLTKVLFTQPYVRIDHLVEARIGTRQTASRYLTRMADLGLLEKRRTGRSLLYVNAQLLALLDSATSS